MWCYEWPGNIRELRNTVERCVALCNSATVDLSDLPDPIQAAYERSIRLGGQIPEASRFPSSNKLAAARLDGEAYRGYWRPWAVTTHNRKSSIRPQNSASVE